MILRNSRSARRLRLLSSKQALDLQLFNCCKVHSRGESLPGFCAVFDEEHGTVNVQLPRLAESSAIKYSASDMSSVCLRLVS